MQIRICLLRYLCLAIVAATGSSSWGAVQYWDINGSTAGAGGASPSADWDPAGVNLNWNASPDGTGADMPWTAGSDAVFAAGNDATGAYTATVLSATSLASLTVEEGAVSLLNGSMDFGAIAGAPINVFAGASLTQSSNTFAGTGGLTKTGAGTLQLRGTNTFTKSGTGAQAYVTIAEGVVDFLTDLNLGAMPTASDNSEALTIDGGTLRYAGSTDVTLAAKRGVRIGPSGGTIDVPNAVNFALPTGAQNDAALTGSGTLTKTGIGRFSLTRSQTTFTGKYVVTGGSLSFNADGNFGAVPVNTQPDYFTLDGGALRVNVTSFVTINAKRGITLGANGGTMVAPIEGISYGGVIAGAPGAGLTVSLHDAVPDTYTFGLLTLNGLNTYDGPTKIEAGAKLTAGNLANGGVDSGIGRSSSAASNLVLNGGTLAYQGGSAVITDRNFTVTQLGGAIENQSFNSYPLVFSSTDPITLSGVGPRTFTLRGISTGNSLGVSSFAPVITDQGVNPTTLAKTGTGTWILTNTNNSYTGNTAITSGKLRLGASGVIPDASLVTISGISTAIELNGFDETVRSISGANGSIALGARTLTLGAPNSETFSGVISGAGGKIVKAGSGKLTLGGVNTYTGDTMVQAGTLQINSPYLANGADVRMANGTVFNLNFAGLDIIDSLYINGLSQALGTWGAIGSGATYESDMFSGSGMLKISNFYAPNAGDFNSDGRVDAADYVTWRKNVGSNDPLPNSNGLKTPIGQAHYDLWLATFGDVAAGTGLGAERAVPEPGGAELALIGLCAFFVRRLPRTAW